MKTKLFCYFLKQNETKDFEIKLGNAGAKTCIVVDWKDDTPFEYWGNLMTCRLRFPDLEEAQPFDTYLKTFKTSHVYV